eukprot:2038984-Rhodomonas_salina.3
MGMLASSFESGYILLRAARASLFVVLRPDVLHLFAAGRGKLRERQDLFCQLCGQIWLGQFMSGKIELLILDSANIRIGRSIQ